MGTHKHEIVEFLLVGVEPGFEASSQTELISDLKLV